MSDTTKNINAKGAANMGLDSWLGVTVGDNITHSFSLDTNSNIILGITDTKNKVVP
ncbi:hypothetical protein FLA4_12120 [Candidatus Rickettsia kotlanii]|nr:hypothetical protein FLA4_12120 [Candidatus Rickettsia kotlanii]BDU62044.1 hypothetical protein HM2_12120 [Candidatus Rickettsia kotlanii]